MRVRFATTLRLHMRDPKVFTPSSCWTKEQSLAADEFLQACRHSADATDEDVLQRVTGHLAAHQRVMYKAVWAKMQTFPYMYEIAAARQILGEYDLNGHRKPRREQTLTSLTYERWNVP